MATFALVHGAWIGPWCWELVIPPLRAAGHEVVAPELPCEDLGATFETYAEVVLRELRDERAPILVGHSLGGMTIPLVAQRLPDASMVFVCAYLRIPGRKDGPPQFREGFGANLRDDAGRSSWSRERAVRQLFGRVPLGLAESSSDRLRAQSQSPFAAPYPLSRVPTRRATWVLATEDEAFTTAWSRWAARELVGVEPVELPGGHFPMLERPSELVELLLEQAA